MSSIKYHISSSSNISKSCDRRHDSGWGTDYKRTGSRPCNTNEGGWTKYRGSTTITAMNDKLVAYSLFLTTKGIRNEKYVSFIIPHLIRNKEWQVLLIPYSLFVFKFAECRFAEFWFAECRFAECLFVKCRFTECGFGECRFKIPIRRMPTRWMPISGMSIRQMSIRLM